MKILAVDHNAVGRYDRGLYIALDGFPDLHLTLLVPRRWQESYGEVVTFEKGQAPLRILSGRVVFSGRSHRVMYRSLGTVIRTEKPDVLYVNAEPESFLAAQALFLRNHLAPEAHVGIASWRNLDSRRTGYPYKLGALHERIEHAVRASVDDCVAHTETIRTTLSAAGFTRSTVIPPCVDTSLFAPSQKGAAPNDDARSRVVGFVGRFVPLKGIDILLRATVRVDPHPRILLIGDGPERSRLLSLAGELNISGLIEWSGPVSHHILPSYLRRMDALVLPSRSGGRWKEQFGRVVIEAMACGVPVVGSSSGEIPRVIGDAGLTFAEGDEAGLGIQLTKLLTDDHLREALIERGLKLVRETYAIEVVAPQYLALFRRHSGRPRGDGSALR